MTASVRFHLGGAGESTYTIGLQAGGDVVVGTSADGDFSVTRFFSDGKRDIFLGGRKKLYAAGKTSDNEDALLARYKTGI